MNKTNTKRAMSLPTLAIHEGAVIDTSTVNCEPLTLTNSYIFESPEDAENKFSGKTEGHVYSRISNPTVNAFERRVSSIEKAFGGVAFSSGMAAIDAVLTAYLKPGDHVLVGQNIFGTTVFLFVEFYERWGVKIDFVDFSNESDWSSKLSEKTRLVFFETPSNPNLKLVDIEKVSKASHSMNALVVVDNTLATPVITKPLEYGADIVVHSAGKYLDGQGRVGGGVVVGNQDVCEKMRGIVRTKGNCISPFNAWIILKSLETLEIRLRLHSENALKIANFLASVGSVEKVYYPGLTSHPQYALALKQHSNSMHGGIISFELSGDKMRAWRFMANLALITNSTNIGDTKTLITHPASTTHGRLTNEQKLIFGITDSLLRISVGLEASSDLIDDLKYAFQAIQPLMKTTQELHHEQPAEHR
ncbi:MAG: O-succinylhomoserine sulfhydrylase [Candidatus Endobugula sp.]|jgi:O-succinylhomoserine sulfhydrylase